MSKESRTAEAAVEQQQSATPDAEFGEPFEDKRARAYEDARWAELRPKIADFAPDHPQFQRAHRVAYFTKRQAVNERVGDAFRKRSMKLLAGALDELQSFMMETMGIYTRDLESSKCEHGKMPGQCLQCGEPGTPTIEEIKSGGWADNFVNPRRRSNS
jgi:hypothetical protein